MKGLYEITSRRRVHWARGAIRLLLSILLLSSPANMAFAQEGSVADHVVISEVQTRGATSTHDEFVELYNPLSNPVDMTDWRLSRRTPGGTRYNLLTTFPPCAIPAFGYFLIAHPSVYTDTRDAAYSTSQSIASSNTIILYSDAGLTVVDMVGMGSATVSETATISNPVAGGSIERKAQSTSTADSMGPGGGDEFKGNGHESDDNSQDFVLRAASEPQNSSAPVEYPPTAIVVTSTADAGPGTLRQVLLDAVSGNAILFDTSVFPPTSPTTISLQSALPEIAQGDLTIDGSDARVILDGSGLSSGAGLHITSDGNTIKRLQILYFPEDGVRISGGAGYNLIGGSTATEGNIIAHNGLCGAHVHGKSTLTNTISHSSIHSNADKGIDLSDGGNLELSAPSLTRITSYTVKGIALPNATIEVFSDLEDEGQIYEGTTIADATGHFTLAVSTPFSLSNITATATDAAGNTSEFSSPMGFMPQWIYLPLVTKGTMCRLCAYTQSPPPYPGGALFRVTGATCCGMRSSAGAVRSPEAALLLQPRPRPGS
jgi:hypothetical protein